MEETRPYIPWNMIEGFMIDTFVAYGVPLEDAKICTDVLLESDRRGIESHGMILMAQDADGRLEFVAPLTEVRNGSEVK